MPNDPTLITGAVTTATETATGTAVEPSLTLTQLHALLRDAAAYERAKRPLVIHQTNPDTTTTAPAPHPGINVTVPAPGATLMPAQLRRPARAGGWGVWVVYASMATLLTGAADGVFAGTAPLPVALCAAGILGAIGGTARALTEERQAQVMTPGTVLAFYTALTVWLTGFALAAVTAGATGAVVTGTLGLLATLATVALRIDAAAPHTGRTRTRPRTCRGPR